MVSLYRQHQKAWSQPWVLESAKTEMQIIEFIQANPGCSSDEIFSHIQSLSDASTYYMKNLLVYLTKAEIVQYNRQQKGYYIYEHD